jgi:hypothetical protein
MERGDRKKDLGDRKPVIGPFNFKLDKIACLMFCITFEK